MPEASTPAPRRRILKILFGASVAALSGGAAVIAERFLRPLAGEIATVFGGHLADLTPSHPVKTVKLGVKEVMLVRAGDTVSAIDLKCTHAGCTVHWVPERAQFRCPCHGGVYSAEGKVLDGPPPRPLSRLRVAVNSAGEITVTDLPA